MSHKGAPAPANKPTNPAKPKADKKTPRERFLTVGAGRVTKVLRSVRSLSNVASRKSYEYSAEDISKAFAAIDKELSSVKKTFETALAGGKPAKEKEQFTF